jgi:hypothetical protein
MVLFGLMIGRSTGSICDADSYFSVYTRVWSRSPSAALLGETEFRCSLASASGRIFTTPSLSTAV